jgi:hypothetical protein
VVRRERQGNGYVLNLNAQDRDMLRQLVPQFSALFDEPDQPVLRRLFPPAYSESAYAEQEAEYRRLMREDLVSRHREELELVVSTSDATRLSEEELLAWTRALNTIRLVLGTFLDVQEGEERRRPESTEESLYHWLSYVQGEAIEALAGGS